MDVFFDSDSSLGTIGVLGIGSRHWVPIGPAGSSANCVPFQKHLEKASLRGNSSAPCFRLRENLFKKSSGGNSSAGNESSLGNINSS